MSNVSTTVRDRTRCRATGISLLLSQSETHFRVMNSTEFIHFSKLAPYQQVSPTIIQNACLAYRTLVKCTEIHLSFPSLLVGDWFPRSYEIGIGGAISQMLLNMRSVLSGKLYLQFERQMCVVYVTCLLV
jgi:hypothetical protein